jgi:hypothetical protein
MRCFRSESRRKAHVGAVAAIPISDTAPRVGVAWTTLSEVGSAGLAQNPQKGDHEKAVSSGGLKVTELKGGWHAGCNRE